MSHSSVVPLVKSFVGERYAATGRLSKLIAPPYDVISDERRSVLAAQDEHNIVRLILPEGDDRFGETQALLHRWRETGVFVPESAPGVYVVSQSFATADGVTCVRRGLIAPVAAERYSAGRVRPHEKTHRGPKVERLELLRRTHAMTEALLMLAPDPNGTLTRSLQRVTNRPELAHADLDGVGVRMWHVPEPEAGDVLQAVAKRLYIADGHHRYETASAYRQEVPTATHTLGFLVSQSDPGLVVLPTHRILVGDVVEPAAVRRLLGGSFDVETVETSNWSDVLEQSPSRTRCIVVLPHGTMSVMAKAGASFEDVSEEPTVSALNVARIDARVVEPLRREGAGELRYDARGEDVIAAVAAGRATVGILVPATTVAEVLAVSDAGGVMPQKSTFFYPKVPSGLVIYPLDP